jgi:hypothetical protein
MKKMKLFLAYSSYWRIVDIVNTNNTQWIEKTAQIFGISFDAAKAMCDKASERNTKTHTAGKCLAEAVQSGLALRGGIANASAFAK